MHNLMVFFFPTNICHRGCDGCYNPSVNENMSIEIADKAINWLKNICIEEKVEHLRVSFLGGEPLNVVDTVLYLVDQMESNIGWVTPLPPDGHIFHTNGDLLTKDILKVFKVRRIKIALNPTYDSLARIEDKICQIKAICGGCTLSIVLNKVNMPRITNLAQLAVKHHCQMRINRLYDGGKDSEYVKEYGKQMKEVLEILLASPRPIWPNWIVESTYPSWKSVKNPYSCGRWLVIIDPDGTLRSCNPDKDTVIGHIDTHIHWSDLKCPQRWSAKNIPECHDCEWVTLCQAGCPYVQKLTFGEYGHKSPFCEEFKKLFPLLMKLNTRWENK